MLAHLLFEITIKQDSLMTVKGFLVIVYGCKDRFSFNCSWKAVLIALNHITFMIPK